MTSSSREGMGVRLFRFKFDACVMCEVSWPHSDESCLPQRREGRQGLRFRCSATHLGTPLPEASGSGVPRRNTSTSLGALCVLARGGFSDQG